MCQIFQSNGDAYKNSFQAVRPVLTLPHFSAAKIQLRHVSWCRINWTKLNIKMFIFNIININIILNLTLAKKSHIIE